MARPSIADGRAALREAKASARPMMAQLVTINGMKMPRIRYRSWNQACISIWMTVTTEAMIRTKAGMRISGLRIRRLSETATLEQTSVRVVASPSPMALMTVALTASSGHNPSNTTSPVFCCQMPSVMIFR